MFEFEPPTRPGGNLNRFTPRESKAIERLIFGDKSALDEMNARNARQSLSNLMGTNLATRLSVRTMYCRNSTKIKRRFVTKI